MDLLGTEIIPLIPTEPPDQPKLNGLPVDVQNLVYQTFGKKISDFENSKISKLLDPKISKLEGDPLDRSDANPSGLPF